ncbi:MAG: phosphatase PAP2/dual specificity phosphatase family protein [Rhizobiales bacterium]|nr:phosphatase PAP2/dual specificity phosphatase family protein [Hyphomicrobiales bacterium]
MTDVSRHKSGPRAVSLTDGRPWSRALMWFAGLVPFFFLSYGLANTIAAANPNVGSIVYPWEQYIPFLPWSIVPYWSIDLFYGAALFLCLTSSEVDTLAKRLLSVQVIAVVCFILFPLTFSFDRPEVVGLPGLMYSALKGFDKPFNQAPSLHIALLVVLWVHYVKHVSGRIRKPLHVWFTAIGVSVLSTYQHHFIDVPTGALLGLFSVWLWPARGAHALAGFSLTTDPHRLKLAAAYGLAGIGFGAPAWLLGGAALWLIWPAVSVLLVAAAYAGLGEAAFQKNNRGRIKPAVKWLLASYLLGAWINSRAWTRSRPQPVHIADDVWIGRFPSALDLRQDEFAAVIDMTAELPAPRHAVQWQTVPNLDLVVPTQGSLREAVHQIAISHRSGPVLVCCALGFSRSAQAVATWLVTSGRCASVDDAVATVRAAQPHFNPSTPSLAAMAAAA